MAGLLAGLVLTAPPLPMAREETGIPDCVQASSYSVISVPLTPMVSQALQKGTYEQWHLGLEQ